MDISENIECIGAELSWLSSRIDNLLHKDFSSFLPLPPLKNGTAYEKLVTEHKLTEADRAVLNLAFASLFRPALLAPFTLLFNDAEKKSHFGGICLPEYGQFYPTVRTALFLLAGGDEEMMGYHLSGFSRKHPLFASGLLLTFAPEGCQAFLDQRILFNE
jgi:hypothetical protein